MAKKILIIDDSALMRRVISDIINSGDDYEVAAIAKDGLEGFDLIVSNPNYYSVVILDINMPKMNGLELLEKLQKNRIEQTVIIVSTVAKQGAKETIRALELGAFDFVTKPENYLETKGNDFKSKIHAMLDVATEGKSNVSSKLGIAAKSDKVKAAARDVETIMQQNNTRAMEFRRKTQELNKPVKKFDSSKFSGVKTGKKKIVAMACSTGGPKSLQQVIPLLPKNLDAPVVLVQHMPAGFTASLASRLNEMGDISVKEAADGDVLKNGWVYIAPGGQHLRIVKGTQGYAVKLSNEPAIDGLRPCANIMYESLQQCGFDEIVCVVLTGMGADGTNGIKGLAANHKKIHVIAQDEESCVVYGMPKAIAQTGLVDEVVSLSQVAEKITKNVGVL